MKRRIFCTVTNELVYDQRMQRICGTLQEAGYEVTLVGVCHRDSASLDTQVFKQVRLHCFFQKGKVFYAEYNFRLCIYLLFRSMDLICAVDLDTILPVYLVSSIKRIPRVYDAHEWFTEMKEVVSRPPIRWAWLALERWLVPKFPLGYTVSEPIAQYFKKTYGLDYALVRNMPLSRPWPVAEGKEGMILYQGAVNEGRCFEYLIPAMKTVQGTLHIYGDGNFMDQVKKLVATHQLEKKIFLLGRLKPAELARITPQARVGITLFEPHGLSNFHSLANRFFDYVQAGVPQVCSDFPTYQSLNNEYLVAFLIEPGVERISAALNNLLENAVLYQQMRSACMEAARTWTWEQESKSLISLYKNLLP